MQPLTKKIKKWTIAKAPETWPLNNIVSRWNLDAPKAGDIQDDAQYYSLRGWALKAKDVRDDLHVVLQAKAETLSYALNAERPDVVKGVLQDEPTGHKQLTCGFALSVPATLLQDGIILGFETNGLIHSAATISLADADPLQS